MRTVKILNLYACLGGKYVVENVIPFYEPLVSAQKRGRHLYWTNFVLPIDLGERPPCGISTVKDEVKQSFEAAKTFYTKVIVDSVCP